MYKLLFNNEVKSLQVRYSVEILRFNSTPVNAHFSDNYELESLEF